MTQGREAPIVICVDSDLADLVPGYLENRGREVGEIAAMLAAGDYES